jgi:regulatory protein
VTTEPYDACIRWLTRREHSRVELRRKLADRFPETPTETIETVLDRLVEHGLQSDDRFAEMLIRTRIHQGQGRLKIVRELATHHIELTDLSDYWTAEHSEVERCQAVLEKWLRGKAAPTPAKALRFLASRGFEFSDATEAVNAIFR